MNTNMQGHGHGMKGHLLWMLGIGGVVLVVLLGAGRTLGESLPLALFLACPLMMIGMMFMMRGDNGHQHGNDATGHRDHGDASNHRDHDASAEWQDTTRATSARPQDTTRL
jgi:Protein of unknown function (DUF2933)